MTITAQVIADSVSRECIRLTTMQLRYPKFIHGEFMTHRVFSRNASSSRAVPVERMLDDICRDPAIPVWWGKNQPGMQAKEELAGASLLTAQETWLHARESAIGWATQMMQLGTHKQIVNRLLEPFLHINVVVTATDWANFFALRCHPDAQPEMRTLAEAMRSAMQQSTPVPMAPLADWHLPYFRHDKDVTALALAGYIRDPDILSAAIKLSVARCARVSYLTHEGKTPSVDEDLKLYDRLVTSVPLHASPAEHQATPDHPYGGGEAGSRWQNPDQHGNFRGWRQYRKMLSSEYVPG